MIGKAQYGTVRLTVQQSTVGHGRLDKVEYDMVRQAMVLLGSVGYGRKRYVTIDTVRYAIVRYGTLGDGDHPLFLSI
jgi:hypothetical protein